MDPNNKQQHDDIEPAPMMDADEAASWFAELFKKHPVADRECPKCGCVNDGKNQRCWNCLARL